MATYKELQDEVLAHGFNESYRTRVKSYLNIAQSRIAKTIEVNDNLATVSLTTAIGTSNYLVPSEVEISIHGIVDEQLGYRLDYIKMSEELIAQNANGTFNGRPIQYSIQGVGIVLSPVPDAIYTFLVLYFIRPVNLSADSDISTLPVDYHDLMISFALQRCYRSEDDAQMAQFYQAEYNRDLQLLGASTTQQSEDPTQVPGSWGR